MAEFIRLMLIVHFVGLAMGIGAGIANLLMLGLIARAAPQERPILARFPPMMGRIGDTGLALLIASGLTLVFTKYSGFGQMPGVFHAKLTVVVLLLGVVGMRHMTLAKIRRGNTAAAARLPMLGRIGLTLAFLAIALAVMSFN